MPILNNAVPMAVHNQIRWERDQAMQQLKDHGIPFGGVAPDVVEVVRCKDCRMAAMLRKPKGEVIADCMLRKFHTDDEDFIEVRGDDFCSYGVRREDDA